MNKTELIAKVAEKSDFTKKDTAIVVDALCDVIKETVVTGDKVGIVGFGVFETSERAAREGRNPQTGEKITIPASKAPKFKASKVFKEMVNV